MRSLYASKKKKACKPHLLNQLITVSVSFINIIFASSNKQGVSMQVIIYYTPVFLIPSKNSHLWNYLSFREKTFEDIQNAFKPFPFF